MGNFIGDLGKAYESVVRQGSGVLPITPGGPPLALVKQLKDTVFPADEPVAPAPLRRPTGAGKGSGGGNKPNPLLRYVRRQNPDLSRREAKQLVRDFRVQSANPGLSEFVQSQTNKVDPNTMQMFFAQTVAPYLKQTQQQFQTGATAGTEAMKNILSGAAPSPAIDVLKQWLPVEQAGNQKMGAALEAATITAPYYDQLLSQLQENIAQQQRTQFTQQQIAAGGVAAESAEPSFGALAAQAALQGAK